MRMQLGNPILHVSTPYWMHRNHLGNLKAC